MKKILFILYLSIGASSMAFDKNEVKSPVIENKNKIEEWICVDNIHLTCTCIFICGEFEDFIDFIKYVLQKEREICGDESEIPPMP